MFDSLRVPKPITWKQIGSQTVMIVLLYQLVAIAFFASTAVSVVQWLQTPFLGGMVDHNLQIRKVSSSLQGSWPLTQDPELSGYQVQAIDGIAIRAPKQLNQLLRIYSAGQGVTLTLLSPDGDRVELNASLTSIPLADRVAFFFIPSVIGLIYLISGLWVFNLRSWMPASRIYAIFTASAAISIAGFLDSLTVHSLTYIWLPSIAMAGGSLLSLALVFPEKPGLVERWPNLRLAGWAFALVISGFSVYLSLQPGGHRIGWDLIAISSAAAFLVLLLVMARGMTSSHLPVSREQSRLLLFALIIAFLPLIAWYGLRIRWPEVQFSPFLLAPAVIFPYVVSYLLLRSRPVSSDDITRRAVMYVILSALILTAYVLLVSGATLLFSSLGLENTPYLVGIAVIISAGLFNPLRERVQLKVDEHFSRRRLKYSQLFEVLTSELAQTTGLLEVVDFIRRFTRHCFRPDQLHVFIYDPNTNLYAAAPDDSGRPTTDLRFPHTSPLICHLKDHRTALFMETQKLPAVLQPEKARLALLNAHLFVPLHGPENLIGWLALGKRRSDEPYSERDLVFLDDLSNQAAQAIERAQVVADLERRMHELNILTRVSQGVNITLAFDDILELLYAQTNQIIPTLDFRITLLDPLSSYLYHVFYLENDERLLEYENIPLPPNQGLEQTIITSRRPLLTDDYTRECRSRGVLPASEGLYSWMGAPLNAGAETIGLISLGSRDPLTLYTEEQLNLLTAVADQAAGAIVKGRLLQEAELRTHQLTTLNEIARSLTSTLELDRLLNQILNSAVEILNSEAGSLLLTDEQTNDLIFEVAAGPVAADLIGQRLPAGTGLVGKAVEERQPILANDARRTKEWFEKPDQETGFTTQHLLVVPMLVKDRVIGVLEVINRKDGLPFTQDDLELLAAFTSQAAIAVENARLYTLTDQALAARVDELSVMQRIDRELNASLDVSRAMRITLSWAMRQSGADAGLIGSAEAGGIRIIAFDGYKDELAPYLDSVLPSDQLPAIAGALQSARIQTESGNGLHPSRLLPQARSSLAIPICQEDEVIGILHLESRQIEQYTNETLAFLSRLIDHAAIAISNARLYTAVQEANLEKSKFVSFVAHELKNPMSSIKGYTELVAGGMAGQVNEMQSSFLATVSANVDRMNTIVSDLNDLTKIEMGSLRLEFHSLQINDILDEILRTFRRQIEEKELKLTLNIPDTLPLVWGDPTRMTQILMNIFSNAIKYTPQDGQITIGIEPYQQPDQTAGQPEALQIWIKDTGIGIAPEDRESIFTQYFRTDLSKEIAPGTGLGLHITKTLVEMQGGQIWFESELNSGSIFYFTVPLAEANE
jgi:signal transduction histidine kinase